MEAAVVGPEKSKRVCCCQWLMQDMSSQGEAGPSRAKLSLGDEVRATLELSPICVCLVSWLRVIGQWRGRGREIRVEADACDSRLYTCSGQNDRGWVCPQSLNGRAERACVDRVGLDLHVSVTGVSLANISSRISCQRCTKSCHGAWVWLIPPCETAPEEGSGAESGSA